MKMVELGFDIYLFIERKEIDFFGFKNCFLDIYLICLIFLVLIWMYKVGLESNLLVIVGGKVVREFDFKISVDCFTMDKNREFLVTDLLGKRLMKVIDIEIIFIIYIFENLIFIGICCSRDDNILVILCEVYYDYNVIFEKRRFLVRVFNIGEYLMEIEFYDKGKIERFFVVFRRVVENKNGDIIVVDKI